jgi:osmoprotectant transport system ATP-binding protein
MKSIRFDAVTKHFGAIRALGDVSLEIEGGAFCVLIGPSGCGKSTALRMINAMIRPDQGRITIGHENIAQCDPVELRRRIGYVIQSVGLFPHWTVAENIAAVPRLLGWSKASQAIRAEEMASLLGIDGMLLERYPHQLSGGQQQRVGVARALAADPEIILMDEPFAALDPTSRAKLQAELQRIHARSSKTIVFVTHDMDEALRLATRMVIMDHGHVVQSGPPTSILGKPANAFVEAFLGGDSLPMRLLDKLEVRDRSTSQEVDGAASIAADASLKQALDLMLATRSTSLAVVDQNGARQGAIHIADIITGGAAGRSDAST